METYCLITPSHLCRGLRTVSFLVRQTKRAGHEKKKQRAGCRPRSSPRPLPTTSEGKERLLVT